MGQEVSLSDIILYHLHIHIYFWLWDTEIGVYTGFTSGVTGACYDQSEQYLFAASLDRSAKLWDLKSSKMLYSFSGHIDYINQVITANSIKKGYTASSDRTIKEWDLESKKLIKTFSSSSAAWSICISHNDNFLYSGHADGSIKIWSVSSSEKPEAIMDIHDDKVISLKIGKNENQILTLSK